MMIKSNPTKELFLGEFSPLGDPKKRGSANPTKDSFGKEVPKSPYFDGKKTEIAISRQQVLVCHQQIAGILNFLLSSLSHVSQILLSLRVEDPGTVLLILNFPNILLDL